jgi:hypothetical protein
MTMLTDATTGELTENDLVAVPRADWTAMQKRMDDIEAENERRNERLAAIERKLHRYDILRDVVASTSELDADTIDQLVTARLEGDD